MDEVKIPDSFFIFNEKLIMKYVKYKNDFNSFTGILTL